jgi:thiol-disulfide isomerase/thioredoxin
MIERLIVLLILVGVGALAYQGFRRWQVRRAAGIAPTDPVLVHRRPGIPAILYFTSPTCVPCKTVQRPALQALLAEMGDTVQVIEVNALEQTEVANRWGVMSIPTTFILDRQGTPRQVNYGVTNPDTFKRQLAGL